MLTLSRRQIVRTTATIAASAMLAPDVSRGMTTARAQPLIGIQMGGHSLLDEGMDRCLDLVQSTCRANSVFLYSHSYYAAHGRAPELYADHGLPIKDERRRDLTRVWLRHHAEAFKHTALGVPEPKGEYANRDLFAETLGACKKRGLKLYARILEPDGSKLAGRIANYEQAMSVDLNGKPSLQPCRNNPEWMAWWDALVSDTMRSYPLDGFQWGAERMGPLSSLLWRGQVPFCFCSHCEARAKREGINPVRARQGFTELHGLITRIRAGGAAPADGVFTNVLRLMVKFPEVLAWDYQWRAALEDQGRRTYAHLKAARPAAQVGRHFDHQNTSWDALFLAQWSYADVAPFADFIKPILYHDILAPRLANQLAELKRGPLAELSLPQSLDLYYALRGYDPSRQPKLHELATRGMDPEYVGIETKRIVDLVQGKCAVISGVGVDVPNTAPGAPDGGKRPSDQAALRAAIMKAFAAGAAGILVSREYDEMQVESLKTIGATLIALGKA